MKKDKALSARLAKWYPLLLKLALKAKKDSLPLSKEKLKLLGSKLHELSCGFTRERKLAGQRYFSSLEYLTVYLLYFWPVSYAQTWLAIKNFLGPNFIQGSSVLDIGSGPAPAALAALQLQAKTAVICDYSRPATALGCKLASQQKYSLIPYHWDVKTGQRPPPGQYKLIILSHLLNELWNNKRECLKLRASFIANLQEKLEKDGRILIIEPALRTTSRQLLGLRNELVQQGFFVQAPCLNQNPCPCLKEEQATCHASFSWQPPPILHRLAHQARLGRQDLSFSVLILGKATEQKETLPTNLFRIVSEKMLSKSGHLRYFICGPEGRFTLKGHKDLKADWVSIFNNLNRYDLIKIENYSIKNERVLKLSSSNKLVLLKNLFA